MKKILKNKKTLLIIIIAIVLTGVTYVAAQTLIDSKNVIYTDNSKLNASNVQDAIDGTCSNIDKRLSAIEDKLYTVQNINVSKRITPSTDFLYTGVYVNLPAKSYCSVTGGTWYDNDMPVKVALNRSSTVSGSVLAYNYPVSGAGEYNMSVTTDIYTDNALAVYLWVQYATARGTGRVGIQGFCATKYKQ